jgi:hypothetical protein
MQSISSEGGNPLVRLYLTIRSKVLSWKMILMFGNLDEFEVESASRWNIPTLKPTKQTKSNVIFGRCNRRSRQEDRMVVVRSCRSWRRGSRRCKPQDGKRGGNRLHMV